MVGINYKDAPDNARRFLGRYGNPFGIVGVDGNGRAAIEWGVYGVPETFIVGRDGTIVYKLVGPVTPDNIDTVLKAEIDKALKRGIVDRHSGMVRRTRPADSRLRIAEPRIGFARFARARGMTEPHPFLTSPASASLASQRRRLQMIALDQRHLRRSQRSSSAGSRRTP